MTYEEVSSESSKGLLARYNDCDDQNVQLSSARKVNFPFLRNKLHVSILLLSFFLTEGLLITAICRARWLNDKACIRRISAWSPALDAIKLEDVTIHNVFDEKSIYRGPPTPEREDAWRNLWHVGMLAVADDQWPHLNKSNEETNGVIYERVRNGGHAVILDVHHQLHCLNFIRQYTWLQSGNYGLDSPSGVDIPDMLRSSDVGNRMHVDHCVETLRKVLQCHSDVTPMAIIQQPGGPPIGDFNIRTKCRNFDDISRWVRERTHL